ncbi:RBBP9/YdeN family alpha/beta hydrolase [Micromonospora sp. DT81.3]|uniref:RBBP9/YdeN family alpha/beta hydrolase n=1 Tax=Micromonospora sp. DT81.3 TaxID=3416523 RepID=UPI003CFA65A9
MTQNTAQAAARIHRPPAFLILHGWENRREPEHWQHWLAYELLGAGAVVTYPTLPNPDHPNVGEWMETLQRQLSMLRSHDVTVVCHSLACALWVTYVNAGLPCIGVSRVALVSPPSPRKLTDTEVSPFVEGQTRLASPASQAWTVFASDNDPYCPEGITSAYQVDDDINLQVVPSAAHINPASGFGQWPQVLDWCIDRR